ncbi:MAG: hypothetical protein J1E77_09370 [Prevotella sp.]|nr:hypothetical protein [Prevotella sp.]
MVLHIFNPEHDIALASGLANFTAPHAGRQLRHDLGFLPALWAGRGDVILVDNVELAQKSYQRVRAALRPVLPPGALPPAKPLFAHCRVPLSFLQDPVFCPWGWNLALKSFLVRMGYAAHLLPSDAQLDSVRQLSHRREAARLLPALRRSGTVGEAFECRSTDEAGRLLRHYGRIVMKAPWSSSGRGVRFADLGEAGSVKQANDWCWLGNVISRQGSVMIEPYYAKVRDFGMEFHSDGQGGVTYQGLSLFHTVNGAYEGNLLATETKKQEIINRYIPATLLDDIKETVCAVLGDAYKDRYQGPFGIDMMVVGSGEGYLLHPCVEINLRRTMGHVALALSPSDDDVQRVMCITYSENNYKLNIKRI